MPSILRSICSCTFKAFTKLFWLSKEEQGRRNNDRSSPVFSVEQSLQNSTIAPMSTLFVSSGPSSCLLSDESSMIGYGTESESPHSSSTSSPDSSDLGKNLSSIFTAASDSALTQYNSDDGSNNSGGGAGALVTPPLESDAAKVIASIMQSEDDSLSIRPFNMNATHFHENRNSQGTLGLGASVKSITPSASESDSTAYMGGLSRSNVTTTISADASSSSTDNESIEKKKYPVTPYPKLTAFSSPTTVKKQTKLPKSVLVMRRGLVKTRVGNIQKKLDRQEKETCS